MNIVIDDWWEMIIAGAVIVGALLIVYFIIKLVINNGGIRMKNLKVGQQKELPCINYVSEHSKLLLELKTTLNGMESERLKAREENSETNKAVQTMFKTLAISMDGLIEAFQKNNIGNGNLEKARKGLSKMYDIQDGYLINQL